MATPGLSSARERLDAELDDLERMLAPWVGSLRHPAQFHAQFDALASAILDRADPADLVYAQARLAAMLAANPLPRA